MVKVVDVVVVVVVVVVVMVDSKKTGSNGSSTSRSRSRKKYEGRNGKIVEQVVMGVFVVVIEVAAVVNNMYN